MRSEPEEELVRAMRAEGEAPTVRAIVHSVARILELDYQRMAAARADGRVAGAGEAGFERPDRGTEA